MTTPLTALGFDAHFDKQLPAFGDAPVVARVAAQHRGGYEVWAEEGRGLAQLAGRLHRELAEEDKPGVGDWVVLNGAPAEGTTTVIEGVFARRTVFTRGAAGRVTKGQVVAANLDLVFVVCGLDSDYNLRRIERYLARVWSSGAQPVVVLTKADLCADVDARLAEVESASIGAEVIVTSIPEGRGVDAIRDAIAPGATAALVGSSGAGKSTLVNALLGEERMATGETRERDGRGQHTTSHRQLILLPGGGLIIDTPGMRELSLADDEGLDAAFEDIEKLAASCRFRDCTHQSEPGCAVKEAVEVGDLAATRLEHYLKLGREAASFELRQDEHQRRKAERQLYKTYDAIQKRSRHIKGEDD
jgi:ribosome biogenesis GTPase